MFFSGPTGVSLSVNALPTGTPHTGAFVLCAPIFIFFGHDFPLKMLCLAGLNLVPG